MPNGLSLSIREFKALPQKQQLICLYENQCKTLKLIQGYKIYYRLTSIIGSFLVVGVGILFKMQLGANP